MQPIESGSQMQKALIIGATGMLGHKALQVLSESFEVAGTVRKALEERSGSGNLNS